MDSSDVEDVVVVRRNRRHLAALRVDSDGEGERPEVVIPATLPVDATQLSEQQLEGGDAPLDTAAAAAEPQPRLVRLKRRGDVAEQQDGGGEDADDEVEDDAGAEEMEEEELEEDEEAAMERRVAEKGTLSDGEGSEEEGGDAAGQEEQGAFGGKGFLRFVFRGIPPLTTRNLHTPPGALDAAVLERVQLLRQARKDKEAQELEQQHILKGGPCACPCCGFTPPTVQTVPSLYTHCAVSPTGTASRLCEQNPRPASSSRAATQRCSART